MVDQPFLDKYCVGYDEKTLPANAPRNAHYKAYILGEGPDGIAKTPEWAAKITSIPAEKIIQLAREIGSAKPAYICQGWGPQRHSNGEQTSRAIAMLSVLTGNVGINGGNSGVREGSWDLGVEWFPMLENPVKTQISVFTWTDAIDHGTEMTATRDGVRGKEKLDVPIKFLWCYASNTLINQHGDINHTHEVLQDDSKCEMIVGIDHFMTASAKYCDILLPDLMPTEQEDLISHESAGNMGYVILAQPATSAKFERKPIYWILSDAQRFTPRQEWKLWIACGAAAGMAAAYRAPLAGSLFIAEVLFGTMMLASLGPVIISAVVALLVSNLINHSDALLYSVQLSVTVQARDYALIISTGVLAGLCGPLLLTLMNACHRGFVSLKLAPPWQLALGGLIVGLLSLFTPAVWGNGYSTVQSFLTAPPLLMIIAGIFLCKLFAVLASSGSGAPGGVFTPTLFIGLAIGMLYGRSLGLWFPDGEEITLLLGLTGMATLLAATTHAPIMSTLMICEMTGEYQLLPGLLIACVIASVISRTLHRDSIYRQHTAKHS